MSRRAEFVIAGGGTSGHVVPALAIGEALIAAGHPREAVRFLGTRRGIEGSLVKSAGFRIVRLPGRGIVRRVSLANLGAAAGLAAAFFLACAVLLRWRPRLVVSVGGFGSLAGSLAAFVWGIPVVVVNVDAVPGAANRLVGRFAAAAAVAFPDTRLRRAVVTGAPVREQVAAVERTDEGRRRARRALSLPEDKSVLAVVGGSLGAQRLNTVTLECARRLAQRADLCLYHVAGERHLAALKEQAAGLNGAALDYRLVGYEDHLPELFAACDLVVCRAGASTVAELCVIGTPAVLVPLPRAPADHQAANARRLAEATAAVVVSDDDLSPERLLGLIDELLKDDGRRAELGQRARALGRPDAARRIAALAEEVAANHRARPARPGSGSMRGEDDQ